METQEKALRYNEGKLDWTLVDFESIEGLVKAMEYGATKYERDNWKKPCDDSRQHLKSAMRHMIALIGGEDVASDSGVKHSGHIIANMMMHEYQLTRRREQMKHVKEVINHFREERK